MHSGLCYVKMMLVRFFDGLRLIFYVLRLVFWWFCRSDEINNELRLFWIMNPTATKQPNSSSIFSVGDNHITSTAVSFGLSGTSFWFSGQWGVIDVADNNGHRLIGLNDLLIMINHQESCTRTFLNPFLTFSFLSSTLISIFKGEVSQRFCCFRSVLY